MTDESIPDARPALELRPIATPRAHEQVAAELRRNIGLRFIDAGEPLPSERALAKHFGVGRATIQAAVRMLEAAGLVESRRGRHGGTFVLRQHGDEIALEHLRVDLRSRRDEIEQALDYRDVIEPVAAELAARRRSEDDLAAIRVAARAEQDAPDDAEILRWDGAFHLAVAAASGNRFLAAGIEQARLVLEDALALLPETTEMRDAVRRQHAELIAAIEAGDGDRARATMARHVGATAFGLREMLRSI